MYRQDQTCTDNTRPVQTRLDLQIYQFYYSKTSLGLWTIEFHSNNKTKRHHSS